MMKVRAWNNDLKQFFYVGNSFSISLHDTGNKVIMWSSDGIVDEFDADEVCLFSGITDINGIDLYEGDVIYLAGYGEYVCEFPFIDLYEGATENDIGALIGSIYQNPELLDAKS